MPIALASNEAFRVFIGNRLQVKNTLTAAAMFLVF